MAQFIYEGRRANGEKVSGKLEADRTDDIVHYLNERGITPITINEIKAEDRPFGDVEIRFPGKVQLQEIRDFCEQMSLLLQAGVAVIDSIKQLSQSTKSRAMQSALSDIADDVIAGQSLSMSLRSFPKIFSTLFVSLINVGESTGNLDEIFSYLAKYIDASIMNRRRLTTALRYPAIVVTAICVAIVVMNIFVIPKFAEIFSRFGKELPWPTRLIINTSNFMLNNWLFLLIAIVASFVIFHFALRIPRFRWLWDRFKLKVPVIGDLLDRIILTQFSWTLGLILRAGVPVIRGMQMSADSAGNEFIKGKILDMTRVIEQGDSFTNAAQRSDLFSAAALQMLTVGEETGQLDDMLSRIAHYYERDVDYDIKRLNDLLEPIILSLVGVMVLILALGVYLPMWDLVKNIQL